VQASAGARMPSWSTTFFEPTAKGAGRNWPIAVVRASGTRAASALSIESRAAFNRSESVSTSALPNWKAR
jgi:hypothetical protein